MTRRLFYVALGATAGVLIVRKLTKAAQKVTPAGVQQSLAGGLSGLGDALRDFTAELKDAMAEREVELLREAGKLHGSPRSHARSAGGVSHVVRVVARLRHGARPLRAKVDADSAPAIE